MISNRMGAVASLDTLKRVILSVSQDRRDQGIQILLVPQEFTVASVDNVDFLQSHAASTQVASTAVAILLVCN